MKTAYLRSDLIVRGRITRIETYTVDLSVDRIYKGELPAHTLRLNHWPPVWYDRSIDMKIGDEFLVYARRSQYPGLLYDTTSINRTTFVQKAGHDLFWLPFMPILSLFPF